MTILKHRPKKSVPDINTQIANAERDAAGRADELMRDIQYPDALGKLEQLFNGLT